MSDTKNPINFDAPGNHSDVGGSYPENEARLSDISQGSMVHAARNLPDGKTPDGFGIKLDERYLKLHPDPLCPQHDEREPGWLVGRVKWPLPDVERTYPLLATPE
jgi:hypothetical protein